MNGLPENARRFDGLADVYDRCRPSYPAAAIAHIMQHCGLQPGMLAVDVGCGTGISSRLLAEAGLKVIGIEPNAEMRATAQSMPAGALVPEYRAGRADATGLDTATADLVLAAQAFHWFANEASLREFQRILKPGGWVALMWNDQARDDAFSADYVQALVRHSPAPAIAAAVHSAAGELLRASRLFHQAERAEFPNVQNLDLEQLFGRAFSASYAPREFDAQARLKADLTMLYQLFQRRGQVALRYRTVVFTARR